MMNNILNKLMLQKGDRIFLDVSYSGCGSGCKYCYVESAQLAQQLIHYSDLEKICAYLKREHICDDKIVSFCPNTEPFKSLESSERILFLIRHLNPASRCFQISTKEEIRDDIFADLGKISEDTPVFINISIPVIDSELLEPYAAPVGARLRNFVKAKPFSNIYSGLYIKPFFNTALDFRQEYLQIIKDYSPDYICVGFLFDLKTKNPCTSLYQSTVAYNLLQQQQESMLDFIAEIKKERPCLIVCSSVCAIYKILGIKCDLKLWLYNSDICNSCTFKQRLI